MRRLRGSAFLLAATVAAGVLLIVPPVASAATFTFPSITCPDDPADPNDIDECIDLMAPGDTLVIKQGLFFEQNNVVDKDVTITGNCKKQPIIDAVFPGPPAAGARGDAFDVTVDGVTIMCLTVRHAFIGVDAQGGGIDDLTVDRLVFIDVGTGVAVVGDRFIIVGNAHRSGADNPAFAMTGNQGVVRDNVAAAADDEVFEVTGDGNQIVGNVSLKSSDDENFFIQGDGNTIRGNIARNSDEDCWVIFGEGNAVSQNEATDCGGDGFQVVGDANTLTKNAVRHTSSSHGISVTGDDTMISRNMVSGAAQDGIFSQGDGAMISDNKVSDAGTNGIEVIGDAFTILRNVSNGGSGENGFEIVCQSTATNDCSTGVIRGNSAMSAFAEFAGFWIRDMGHCDLFPCLTIRGNAGRDNADSGFVIEVGFSLIEQNSATENGAESGEPGMEIIGDSNMISRNSAWKNTFDGIEVEGDTNTVDSNTTKNNDIDGLHIRGGANNVVNRNMSTNNEGDGIENDGTTTDLTNNVSTGNRADCVGNGTTATVAGNSCADGTNFTTGGTVD
jgi:hypothetical protein